MSGFDPLWNNVSLLLEDTHVYADAVGSTSDYRIIGKALEAKGSVGEVRRTQYFYNAIEGTLLAQSGGPSEGFSFQGHGNYGTDGLWGDVIRFPGAGSKAQKCCAGSLFGSGDFTIELGLNSSNPNPNAVWTGPWFGTQGADGAYFRTAIEQSDSSFSAGCWALMVHCKADPLNPNVPIYAMEFWLRDYSNVGPLLTSPFAATAFAGSWAIVKCGNQYSMWNNGFPVIAVVQNLAGTYPPVVPDIRIGSSLATQRGWGGSLNQVRITTGIARYTSSAYSRTYINKYGYGVTEADMPGMVTNPIKLAPLPDALDPSITAPFEAFGSDQLAPPFGTKIADSNRPLPPSRFVGRLPNAGDRYDAANERQFRRAVEETLRK